MIVLSALVLCLAMLVPNVATAAQTNPEGFCQSWLLLGQYNQGGGAGPGLAAMRQDYLTDGAGVTETNLIPTAGTVINTNYAVAASTGLNPGNQTFTQPTIFEWAEPDEQVNFNDAALFGDEDNVMMYAWTYANNTTGAQIFCWAGVDSDDSIQVVINGLEVDAISIPRGAGAANNVANAWPCTLLPGINLVMIKVFEGGGGFNFRFRLQTHGGTGVQTGDTGVAGVTYSTLPGGYQYPELASATRTLPAIGLYAAGLTMPVTVDVTRTTGNPGSVAVTETVPAGWTVSNIVVTSGSATEAAGTISWNVGDMTRDTETMTYDVTAAGAGVVTFTGDSTMVTSMHGTVLLPTRGDTQLSDVEYSQNAYGFAREWVLVGEYLRAGGGGNFPTVAHMQSDFLTDGAGVTEAGFVPLLDTVINTDYNGAAASTGFNGLAQRQFVPTTFLWMDPDDTINCNDANLFGDIDDCMTYGWVVARNKTGAAYPDLYVGVGSDDAHIVYVNGTEVGSFTQSGGRGYGAANEVQSAHGPFTLYAGDNLIRIKVFEGGGGHGFRLRLQTDNATGVSMANMVPPEDVELMVISDAYARATRDIICPGIYRPGDTFQVIVDLTRVKGVPSPTVTETVPAGWTVSNIVTSMGSASEAAGTITWNPGLMTANATMTYDVTAVAGGDVSFVGDVVTGSLTFAITGESDIRGPLPLGIFDWHGDVGTPGDPSVPGSSTFVDPTYTVVGNGHDIWDNADGFHGAFKVMSGSFMMEMDVDWVDPGAANNWSKAGVMVRANLEGGSPFAWCFLRDPSGNPGNSRYFQWRDNAWAGCGGGAANPGDGPVRLRVVRSGNDVRSYMEDPPLSGTWVELDGSPHTVPGLSPTEDVLCGIAMTSHSNGNDSTAIFENAVVVETFWSAVRQITQQYTPGGAPGRATVTVTATTDGNLTLVETLPAGVTPSNAVVSPAGFGSPTIAGQDITWTTPMTAGSSATLTYDAVVPSGVCNQTYVISGTYDFGFGGLPIGGDTDLTQLAGSWQDSPVEWIDSVDVPPSLQPPGYVEYIGCDDSYLVAGAGTDIWGTSDQFHYLYLSVLGDFQIQGLVDILPPNRNAWTKAGFMLRANLTQGSPYIFTHTTNGGPGIGGNGDLDFQYRNTQGGGATCPNDDGSGVARVYNADDVYLILRRTGATVYADYDDNEGTVVAPYAQRDTVAGGGTGVVDMDPAVPNLLGLALTSHSGGNLAYARFTGVLVTGAVAQPPNAPTNLTARGALTDSIILDWRDNSTNETGFRIERSDGAPGTWVEIFVTGPNANSYLDSGLLTDGTVYYYRVRATNPAGDSAYSNTASSEAGGVLDATRWTLYR